MPEGTSCEFNSFHVTDDGAIALVGARFVLPDHNVFVDMIELMVEGQHFDVMVLLDSDNRTMAAARFNLTSTTLYRGATVAGCYTSRKVLLETVYDGVGEYLCCRIDSKNPKGLEDHLSLFASACNTATSGDTVEIYTETLGFTLPNMGTLPVGSNCRRRAPNYTEMRIFESMGQDNCPSRIRTQITFNNTMHVGIAVGGAANTILHMIAIVKEPSVEVSRDTWDPLSLEISILVKLASSRPWGTTEFGEAYAVPVVMKALGDCIDPGTQSVSGKSTGEFASVTNIENPECVRNAFDSVEVAGPLYNLRGDEAQDSSVVNVSGVAKGKRDVTFVARVFEDEDSATETIRKTEARSDGCLIIRNEGTKGSPCMSEMLNSTSAIMGTGRGESHTLVTVGRLPGATYEPAIGYVTPEAVCRDPIALVEDGDTIVIHLKNHRLYLGLSEESLTGRTKRSGPQPSHITRGYLRHYANHLIPTSEGVPMSIVGLQAG